MDLAYLQELTQMQTLVGEWASNEPVLNRGLQAIGDATESSVGAQKNLIESYRNLAVVIFKLPQILLGYHLLCCYSKRLQPLHEYGLYTEAAKTGLLHRDASQIDYEVHMEQLCRVKTEQNQLQTQPLSEQPVMFGLNMWRSPEEVQQQRLQQLDTASSGLSQQVEVCHFSFVSQHCCRQWMLIICVSIQYTR